MSPIAAKKVINLYNDPQVDNELYQRLANDLAQGVDLSVRKTMLMLAQGRQRPLRIDNISKVIVKHYGSRLGEVTRLERAIGRRRTDVPVARNRSFAEVAPVRSKGTAIWELRRFAERNPRASGRMMKREFGYAKQLFDKKYGEQLRHSINPSLIIPEAPEPGEPPFVSLTFQIHEVFCNKETSPTWGKDEIRLGAVPVDEFGRFLVPDFFVKNFDTGDTKVYSPPKKIWKFPIVGSPDTFPKGWGIYVSMAEEDCGGFADFLAELWDAVGEYVEDVLRSAGALAGASVGGALAGPIGALIGALIGFLIGWIVDLIVEGLQDEIFKPRLAMVGLPSDIADFGGSDQSPIASLVFKGHGGKYTVDYNWALSK